MESQDFFIYLLIAIVSVFIYAVIARQIFSVVSFLKRQEAIMKLLAEIAIKNGVDADKVEGIVKAQTWKNR